MTVRNIWNGCDWDVYNGWIHTFLFEDYRDILYVTNWASCGIENWPNNTDEMLLSGKKLTELRWQEIEAIKRLHQWHKDNIQVLFFPKETLERDIKLIARIDEINTIKCLWARFLKKKRL